MSQYKNLLKILSSPDENLDDWNLIRCLFSNLVLALSDSTARSDVISRKVRASKLSVNSYHDIFDRGHHTVMKMFDSVVRPLLTILSQDISNLSREDTALGFVYVGLLRFHALLPTSNIDPGRKPPVKSHAAG